MIIYDFPSEKYHDIVQYPPVSEDITTQPLCSARWYEGEGCGEYLCVLITKVMRTRVSSLVV